MEHTANNKKKLPLWLWLCYGLLLLLAFTGSSLAGYKTTASGTDSARVAAFRYAATAQAGQQKDFTLNPTDATGKSYAFTVSNAQNGQVSEVAQKYTVLLSAQGQTTAWLPNGVTVRIDGVVGAWSPADQAYRFENNAWQFTAGQTSGNSRQHILKFTSSGAASKKISDISITVVFEQLD